MTGRAAGTRRANGSEAALDTVRGALLAAALREVGQRLAAADAEAAELMVRAATRGTETRAAAVATARAAAREAAAARRTELRRAQTAARLAARAAAHDRLRAALAERLRHRCARPEVREGLAGAIRATLGDDAVIVPADGGLVGRADGRRLDLSVPALTERAMESADQTLERLWPD